MVIKPACKRLQSSVRAPGLPLRIQVVPTGSLEARTTADMTIRQVATDTTINGVSQAINNLFVSRAASGGPLKITVDEGDMSLGVLTSTYTVELASAERSWMRIRMPWADSQYCNCSCWRTCDWQCVADAGTTIGTQPIRSTFRSLAVNCNRNRAVTPRSTTSAICWLA